MIAGDLNFEQNHVTIKTNKQERVLHMQSTDDILYEGKSKSVHPGPCADSVILRYKDTATAFNGVKKEEISGKGKLNATISNLIYAYLHENGVETHLIEILDETTVAAKKVEVVPIEVIIRNVAAGRFSHTYGVPEGTPLRRAVVEFALKDDALDDPPINESQILALDLATATELADMTRQAVKINELLITYFAKVKIRLIDFKLEFGRYKDGSIILCDEISPDSCRLWDADTGQKLDKDRFRQDLGDLISGYEEVLHRLTSGGFTS